MNTSSVAEFENIAKDYPTDLLGRHRLRALDGVSFSIEPGEVFGLLGPNRAGKTTLAKILLTLCRPTKGNASRLGRPVQDRATLAKVGYVHENQAFPRYHTAAGLLEYYGALSLVPYEEVLKRVPLLLEKVGLSDRSREPIAQFSKGMVQRLGVAQALINDPELLILDEPNEGLDLEGRQLVRNVIKSLKAQGRTVVLISHVLSEVELVCDRVGVLVGGKLVHLGPLSDLTRDGPLEKSLQELYERR